LVAIAAKNALHADFVKNLGFLIEG